MPAKSWLSGLLSLAILVILSGGSSPATAEPATPTSQVVVVEQPALTPALGPTCTSGWYSFTNNRGYTATLTINTNQAISSTDSAIWQPNLPLDGYYQVEAYIPSHASLDWPCPSVHLSYDTSDAHYTIHAKRQVVTRQLDQKPLNNQWLSLGEYLFSAGTSGYVSLSDLNDETNHSRSVSFSAIRFTLVQTTPVEVYFPMMAAPLINPNSPLKVTVRNQQGFDKCDNPTLAQLSAWWTSSPYRILNLYIGGASRGCANSGLTASWVSSARSQGWAFIPTWVGPQAPCTSFSHKISANATTAYAQGRSEADSAVAAASALGLIGQNGSIIYYDMEAYSSNVTTACRAAVSSFISGWSGRLKELQFRSGGYGSACSSYMTDWTAVEHVPDDVWLASWITNYYSATVGTSVSCLDSGYWDDHQRLRQYAGGHSETWGGQKMNIDSNITDGEVVAPVGSSLQAAAGAQVTAKSPETAVDDVQALASDQGWALSGGQLQHRMWDGRAWQIESAGPSQAGEIWQFQFLDARQGWLVAGAPPRLWRTADGGLTWQSSSLSMPGDGGDYLPVSLNFLDAYNGWLGLRLQTGSNFDIGTLLHTGDGGQSWQTFSLPGGGPALMVTASDGWALAGSDEDQLFHTGDGGVTWQPYAVVGLEDGSYGLPSFPTINLGYLPVFGMGGTETSAALYLTQDGGQSWKFQGDLPNGTQQVSFASPSVGWARAQLGTCQGDKSQKATFTCSLNEAIWQTGDGGLSWELLP